MEDEEEERPMFGDLELRPDAGAVVVSCFGCDPQRYGQMYNIYN